MWQLSTWQNADLIGNGRKLNRDCGNGGLTMSEEKAGQAYWSSSALCCRWWPPQVLAQETGHWWGLPAKPQKTNNRTASVCVHAVIPFLDKDYITPDTTRRWNKQQLKSTDKPAGEHPMEKLCRRSRSKCRICTGHPLSLEKGKKQPKLRISDGATLSFPLNLQMERAQKCQLAKSSQEPFQCPKKQRQDSPRCSRPKTLNQICQNATSIANSRMLKT